TAPMAGAGRWRPSNTAAPAVPTSVAVVRRGAGARLQGQTHFTRPWAGRGFLLLPTAIFLSALSLPFGVSLGSYGHQAAGTAESVIAVVVGAGFLLTWTPPPWSRRAATGAQAFGILGVLVGLFTIAIGIGPRTVLDLTLHGAMLLTLIAGLAITLRKQ